MKPTVISADVLFQAFRTSLDWQWIAGLGAAERRFDEVAVRIEPPVPALLDAAAGVPLGLASKVHMTVTGAEDFPADSQLWTRSDTPQTGGYHLRPFGRAMIEGYFGADLAWGLEAEGEAPVKTA